jgi:hypothetical protein
VTQVAPSTAWTMCPILSEIKQIVDMELIGVNFLRPSGSSICKFIHGSDYFCYEWDMDNLQQNFQIYFIYNQHHGTITVSISDIHNTFEIIDPQCFQKFGACVKPFIIKFIEMEENRLKAIISKRRTIFKSLFDAEYKGAHEATRES